MFFYVGILLYICIPYVVFIDRMYINAIHYILVLNFQKFSEKDYFFILVDSFLISVAVAFSRVTDTSALIKHWFRVDNVSFVLVREKLFFNQFTREQCYDFKNRFAEKFSEKNGFFHSKYW
jgi:hypothetical protein